MNSEDVHPAHGATAGPVGVYTPVFQLSTAGPMVALTLFGLAGTREPTAPQLMPAFTAVMSPETVEMLAEALGKLKLAQLTLAASTGTAN